jgi:hypothetical protein
LILNPEEDPVIATEAEIQGAAGSPFQLDDRSAFERWRDHKLAGYPNSAADFLVPVADPRSPTAAELGALKGLCGRSNMAIYRSELAGLGDKEIPRQLGRQLGLERLDPNMLADEDGITTLSVVEGKSLRGYIPYSNRRLLWHTDGYYNVPDRRIRAMLLHCVSPAQSGGENALLDHEIVYLYMREANPDLVRALMAPDAMTIPANEEAASGTRAAQTGPVFSVDPVSGDLHMRYTARTRSIEWKDDAATRAAVKWLEDFLAGGANGHVLRYRLQAGEGIVCNNVLHNREGFENGERQRVVYRARFYDRISGTTTWNIH